MYEEEDDFVDILILKYLLLLQNAGTVLSNVCFVHMAPEITGRIGQY